MSVPPDGPPAAEWTRLQALFDRLADLSEAEQSTALAEVEADDPRLARAARGLLEKDRAGAAWIGRTVTQAARALAAAVGGAVTPLLSRLRGSRRRLARPRDRAS